MRIDLTISDVWRGNSKLEPMVFEEAFAVKELINDQIKCDPELAYESPGRKAPWLAWGPYIWEPNTPRERIKEDGVHPSDLGTAFVVDKWYQLLTADSTAKPWLSKQ